MWIKVWRCKALHDKLWRSEASRKLGRTEAHRWAALINISQSRCSARAWIMNMKRNF